MEEHGKHIWRPEAVTVAGFRPPETLLEPMEFLSRSWSMSAHEVSKMLGPPLKMANGGGGTILEDMVGEAEEMAALAVGNRFSYASSVTSQLVLERIMSQSVRIRFKEDVLLGD